MMEKTEEQIARDKAAIEAMKGAKSNMAIALDRISHLERALESAKMSIGGLKSGLAPGAYIYPHDGKARKYLEVADDAVAAIVKAIG